MDEYKIKKYKDRSYESTSSIIRFLSRKRFADSFKLLDIKSSDLFLDYRCGDGLLLKLASSIIPPKQIFGYDPAEPMYIQAVKNLAENDVMVTMNISELPYKEFTKITCMEVCEHLTKDKIVELLQNIEKLLADDGKLIMSVPIEVGIPSLIKNTIGFIKKIFMDKQRRYYSDITLKNYIKALFGLPCNRTVENLGGVEHIYGHIGFNHKKFESQLSNYFKIEHKEYSPINFFGEHLNFQIFYVCQKLFKKNKFSKKRKYYEI